MAGSALKTAQEVTFLATVITVQPMHSPTQLHTFRCNNRFLLSVVHATAIPTLVFEVAYSESTRHLRSKVNWWFETFNEVRHVIAVWVRPEGYGARGHHGVGPGERPVLVWHYARTTIGANPPEDVYQLVVPPAGTPACPDCAEEHLDIGSSWITPEEAGGGDGVKTLIIPSADLFHTVDGIPPGFPVNVVVDLIFIRSALESLSNSSFQW